MIETLQILFIFTILVTLHEFGHYLPAKWFKVRVEKFYLFMDSGFALFKKKIGETEWGIGWLPIGGYVKLAGMIDESMDTEQMKQEPQPWEFRTKPAWQRLIIMLGGIFVNLLLALFLYTAIFSYYGKKTIKTEIVQQNGLSFTETGHQVGFQDGDKILNVDGKVQPNFTRMIIDILLGEKVTVERNGNKAIITMTDEKRAKILGNDGRNFIFPMSGTVIDSVFGVPAKKAGLLKNDEIISANNQPMKTFSDFSTFLQKSKQDSIKLNVLRNGENITLTISPDKNKKIGVGFEGSDVKKLMSYTNFSFGGALAESFKESKDQFVYNLKSLRLVVSPKTGAYKQIKSPIGIARMLPGEWDWEVVWNFTAMLSVVLALMNLLPIPGLDGGHALFTIAEMITGRTLPVKVMTYIQTAGMIFLLTLMVLVLGKDLFQLITQKFM
jgi:regulator of sigma E protease